MTGTETGTERSVFFRVTGRVQGVSFRAWTQGTAERLGLAGWVRNRPDGSVEGQVQGPPEPVARFLDQLESGPPAARVDTVETADRTPEPLADFEIRH